MIDARLKPAVHMAKEYARKKPVVYLFNGQGSQYYNMAWTLYQQDDNFRRTLQDLDQHVQRQIGKSMLSVLYDSLRNKGEPFSQVQFTHPAIFCVQYTLANLLRQAGWQPDYVLGISLGEFVAATISGVMDPELALEAVVTQALTIQRNCPSGGMLAIMSSVDFFHKHPELFAGSEMAGINYDEHFVIAGSDSVLERIQNMLRDLGVLCMSLPVECGFHSTLIDPAAQIYLDYLAKLRLKEPTIPCISCWTGKELTSFSRGHFWQVIRQQMRFYVALQWLEQHVGQGRGCIYIDLSPGGTLGNFIKRGLDTRSSSTIQTVITPFDQEITRLEDVKQCLANNSIRG